LARVPDRIVDRAPFTTEQPASTNFVVGVVARKGMYGKTFMSVNRETFVINPDGKIAMHWPKAKGKEEHSQEVLAWLKEHAK
jgi:peroxiredoxin Q/BCP